MKCPKATCDGTLERTDYNGIPLNVCDSCSEGYAVAGSATSRREVKKGRSHYNNTPTTCAAGHKHASKTEAKVCNRLSLECAEDGRTLYQQPRFPLFSLSPTDEGKPFYFHPDFAIVDGLKLVEVIDAKSGKRRDKAWARGKAAFQKCYAIPVQEVQS